MGQVILITGGARSGKSRFALELTQRYGGKRIFIATAEAFDDEMRERIQKHKDERGGLFYRTIEEPLNLPSVLRSISDDPSVVLVDCLTVWVGNLLHHFGDNVTAVESAIGELTGVLLSVKFDLVMVTNEVGMSIVPENRLARRFRDYAGALNSHVAGHASFVYLSVCGIPVTIKQPLK